MAPGCQQTSPCLAIHQLASTASAGVNNFLPLPNTLHHLRTAPFLPTVTTPDIDKENGNYLPLHIHPPECQGVAGAVAKEDGIQYDVIPAPGLQCVSASKS